LKMARWLNFGYTGGKDDESLSPRQCVIEQLTNNS
jgi:hypothetical protein